MLKQIYRPEDFFFRNKLTVKNTYTHIHLVALSHQAQTHYLTQSITTKGPNSCSSRVGLRVNLQECVLPSERFGCAA